MTRGLYALSSRVLFSCILHRQILLEKCGIKQSVTQIFSRWQGGDCCSVGARYSGDFDAKWEHTSGFQWLSILRSVVFLPPSVPILSPEKLRFRIKNIPSNGSR